MTAMKSVPAGRGQGRGLGKAKPVRASGLCRVLTCALAMAVAAPGGASAEPELTLGATVTAPLDDDEGARYALTAASGSYVQGTLSVQGGTADLDLIDGEGRSLRRLLSGATGDSQFRFIAADGRMALRVRADGRTDGRFALSLSHLFPPEATRLPARQPRTVHLSPAIADLAKAVAAGDGTGAFWDKVAASGGTPLIEPHGADGKTYVLTFLARGVRDNARLIGGPTADHEWLTRLGETDVWFKSFVVPAETRLGYRIAPDVPDIPGSPREKRVALLATAQADPLNPRFWPDDAPDRFNRESIVELPSAPVQPGVREESVAAGGTRRLWFASPSLGNQREIALYAPTGFDPADPRALLLVLFDGDRYLKQVGVPAILDSLTAAGRLPPVAVVFIGNTGSRGRAEELPGSAAFADAMADEILPLVQKELRFAPGPERTVLAGSSYGGLAAVRIALAHPEVFGNALSMSGSFWWSPEGTPPSFKLHTAHAAALGPLRPVRVHLSAGLFERGRDGDIGILGSNRHLRDVLVAKGYAVTYREYAAAHGYLSWRGALGDGLLDLFGRDGGTIAAQ